MATNETKISEEMITASHKEYCEWLDGNGLAYTKEAGRIELIFTWHLEQISTLKAELEAAKAEVQEKVASIIAIGGRYVEATNKLDAARDTIAAIQSELEAAGETIVGLMKEREVAQERIRCESQLACDLRASQDEIIDRCAKAIAAPYPEAAVILRTHCGRPQDADKAVSGEDFGEMRRNLKDLTAQIATLQDEKDGMHRHILNRGHIAYCPTYRDEHARCNCGFDNAMSTQPSPRGVNSEDKKEHYEQ